MNIAKHVARNEPVEGELRPFAAELSVINGVVLKGNKTMIPFSM